MGGEVILGKTYDLQVTETGRKGDGMAFINGFVIFVKGGHVGEECKGKIVVLKSTFAIAEKI